MIAIIGTGLVGSGWAIVFARAGYRVVMYDAAAGAAEQARKMIGQRLEDLVAAGLLEDAGGALARIRVAASLAECLDGAEYAQESVLERVDVKQALFSEIDRVVGPHTIVGSSSSGIPASKFTEHVACRARCLIAHPVNPPYLVKVVELVPAPWTAPQTMQATKDLMLRVKQAPVSMTREIDGFILNRLQAMLLKEAWQLVHDGLASVEDVDLTISEGLGMRWSFMGPFETIDLNAPGGVADYAQRFGGLLHSSAESRRDYAMWDEELIGKVEKQRRTLLGEDELQSRMGWRDRRLMALTKHKQGV
jgi:3-hydroxyacyl-CoA dehydrogenase